jgi:hypothetical protein
VGFQLVSFILEYKALCVSVIIGNVSDVSDYKRTICDVTELTLREQKKTELSYHWLIKLSVIMRS